MPLQGPKVLQALHFNLLLPALLTIP